MARKYDAEEYYDYLTHFEEEPEKVEVSWDALLEDGYTRVQIPEGVLTYRPDEDEDA